MIHDGEKIRIEIGSKYFSIEFNIGRKIRGEE